MVKFYGFELLKEDTKRTKFTMNDTAHNHTTFSSYCYCHSTHGVHILHIDVVAEMFAYFLLVYFTVCLVWFLLLVTPSKSVAHEVIRFLGLIYVLDFTMTAIENFLGKCVFYHSKVS